MTGMELAIEAWCLNFQFLWLEHCGCTPPILKGTSPVKDLLCMDKIDSPGVIWFYYPTIRYSTHYWEAFGQMMDDKYPNIDYGVVDTLFISNHHDLGYIDGDDIPDLTLMCLEMPATRITF
jgi:hypothetical protein